MSLREQHVYRRAARLYLYEALKLDPSKIGREMVARLRSLDRVDSTDLFSSLPSFRENGMEFVDSKHLRIQRAFEKFDADGNGMVSKHARASDLPAISRQPHAASAT